jgi:competence protein ComEA
VTRLSDNFKKWAFLSAGIVCVASVFCVAAAFRGAFTEDEEIIVPNAAAPVAEEPRGAQAEPEIWAVYVTGEVARPGVYEIAPGSRVNDAIRRAGGFTRAADRNAVNLAAKLKDEAHISVPPLPADEHNAAQSPRNQTIYANPPPKPAVASPPVSYPDDAPSGGAGKIDINSADSSQLATLPGIGPKLSRSIIAYREENGPFRDIEDIRGVSGIGEKRFEAIKEFIKTGNP